MTINTSELRDAAYNLELFSRATLNPSILSSVDYPKLLSLASSLRTLALKLESNERSSNHLSLAEVPKRNGESQ